MSVSRRAPSLGPLKSRLYAAEHRRDALCDARCGKADACDAPYDAPRGKADACDAPRDAPCCKADACDAPCDGRQLKLHGLKLLLLAPLLALIVTWPALAPTDPDYWWHERTGQLIADTRAVPNADPYSFSAPGQQWVTHEWLTELLFYVVHHQFGYVGNVLLIGLLGCLAALAMFATCRLWGVGELPAVVLVLWAFGMSLGSLGVRPQTITRVLLALAALLLTLYRRRRDVRLLLVFPPLMALWANLHGGFAIGLGLLGLTLIGEVIEAWAAPSVGFVPPAASAAPLTPSLTPVTRPATPVTADETPVTTRETPVTTDETPVTTHETPVRPGEAAVTADETPVTADVTPVRPGEAAVTAGVTPVTANPSQATGGRMRHLWPIAAVTLASILATLLTPNGIAGALYPLAFVPQATGGQQLISEWQPPDLRQLSFAPFGLSLLLAFALGWVRRKPLGVVEALWAIAFALLALQSVRNIQLYATVVTPLLGARLCSELPAFGRRVAEWRNPRRLAVLWSIVVVLSAGVWFARFTQATDWPVQLGREPDASAFPVGGAAYLRDHALAGNLFNQFEWGGYLIYANYPGQRVFIDGRPDMYGNAIFDEYVSVVSLQPNWRQVLDKYAVQMVLVDRDSPLSAELLRDTGWQQVYVGTVERLFQRNASGTLGDDG